LLVKLIHTCSCGHKAKFEPKTERTPFLCRDLLTSCTQSPTVGRSNNRNLPGEFGTTAINWQLE